jgi:hydroxymethylpyrimidine pyrophosphatase-like HAD family hydrolase
MMVFDLDGVVTDPNSESNDVNGEVMAAVAEDLRRRIPVAFNTGRAVEWIEERILPFLRGLKSEELANLLIVGEKGGVVVEFDDGRLTTIVDKTLTLPRTFANDVQKILEADRGGWKLGDYMFWDADKKTMGSVEKLRDVPIMVQEFHKRRAVLVVELEDMMRKHRLHDFKVDATVIATDIEHRTAGKHKGAEQVLSWLGRKHITPETYVTFGDSPSDAEMARTFSATGAPTTFVYVGEPSKFQPPKDARYDSIIMNGTYSADTLEYLNRLAA